MSTKLKEFLLGVGIFVGFGLGIGIGKMIYGPSAVYLPKDLRQQIDPNSRIVFTRPLLECRHSTLYKFPELNKIQDEISNWFRMGQVVSGLSRASVIYRDMNSSAEFSINPDETFTLGNLLQMPVFLAYMKEAEINLDVLRESIEVPVLKFSQVDRDRLEKVSSFKFNQKYPAPELLSKMAKNTDDLAYLALLNHNKTIVDQTIKEIGWGVVSIDGVQKINVLEFSRILNILYNATYLSKDNSEKTMDLLYQSRANLGIRRFIPPTVKVANLQGSSQTGPNKFEIHECGMFYMPNRTYELCVMTEGTNLEVLAGSLSTVSKIVFRGLGGVPVRPVASPQ